MTTPYRFAWFEPNTERDDRRPCPDPDCIWPRCEGDHEPLRCPTTGNVRGFIATVDGRYVCCGGQYPNHQAERTPAELGAELAAWRRLPLHERTPTMRRLLGQEEQ